MSIRKAIAAAALALAASSGALFLEATHPEAAFAVNYCSDTVCNGSLGICQLQPETYTYCVQYGSPGDYYCTNQYCTLSPRK